MAARGRTCYIDMLDRDHFSGSAFVFDFNVYKAVVNASAVVLENVTISGQRNKGITFSISAPNEETETVNLTGLGSTGATSPKIVVAAVVKDTITLTVMDL